MAKMLISLDKEIFLLLIEKLVHLDCSLAVQWLVFSIIAFLWVKVFFFDQLAKIAIHFEYHELRIDVLEREIKDTNWPFSVTVVDVHQTAFKGINRLLQQLPSRPILFGLVFVLCEIIGKAVEAKESLYESDTWI